MSFEVAEGRYAVSMDVMARLIEPFTDWVPWDCDTFTIADVLAVPLGDECPIPYEDEVKDMVYGQTSYHVSRIAYLLRHPFVMDDDDYPTFSPSNYNNGSHPLLDGNHRYAAAVIRGDDFFIVDIDGDLDEAEDMFGIAEREVA